MLKIKIVDGYKIRNTIDVDFSVIGAHDVYPYINKDEIWFDKTFIKEKDFFIKLFKNRTKLIKQHGYEKAKDILRSKENKVKTDKKIIIKLIKKEKDAKIFLVNGALVRQLFDPSFCFGGHSLVYDYIPAKQIWIDNKTNKAERKYITLHELCEFRLMKKGKNYNNSHDYACAAEKEARRNDGIGNYLKD